MERAHNPPIEMYEKTMFTAISPGSSEPFATLTGLVSHYSPSGQEAQAVNWLVRRMQSLGYQQAYADEAGNAVGVMGNGPRQVVLLGHIDTVPGQIPVRVEEGILYGRGSVDAKGPLAAFVDAAAAAGPEPGWQYVVIGALDEERDSIGARHVAAQYRPDFTILGEPSQWQRITLGYKGSAWAQLTVRRDQAHSAGQGENASEAAVQAWETIRDWAAAYNDGKERAFDQILPGLHGLNSGEDGFETWASLRLGVRLPPGFTPNDWYSQVKKLVPRAELKPLGFPIPAHQVEKNTALVRAFLASIRAAAGKPGFVLKTGTSDLNIVAPVWNCPAVVYGPGDSALDHTPDEHLPLSEYSQAVDVLKGVLQRLSRNGSGAAQDEPA